MLHAFIVCFDMRHALILVFHEVNQASVDLTSDTCTVESIQSLCQNNGV